MSFLLNFHVICVVLWTMLGLMSSSEVLPEMKSFGAGGKPAETSWKWSRDIVNVQPDPCTSDSGTTGICYKPSDCNEFPEGVGDGSCALGVGVCCTFIYSGCYLTAKYAAAVFENPSYPNPEVTSYSSCPLAITPANNNICQIRLDFGAFTLAGPNAEGVCDQDSFTVTGATSTVPVICGENSGQHMYFEVTPGFNNVVLDVKTSTAGSKWQISVTQIECTSPSRVPSVCLQYYAGSTGTIKSFNYVTPTGRPTETRQLSNQDYTVCLATQPDFCSVAYTKSSEFPNDDSFSLSGDPSAYPPGTPPPGLVGTTSCTTDYLTIPGAVITDSWSVLPPGSVGDTFCGMNFPASVKSAGTQPFKLHVKTDSTETPTDAYNVGFSLAYSMRASC